MKTRCTARPKQSNALRCIRANGHGGKHRAWRLLLDSDEWELLHWPQEGASLSPGFREAVSAVARDQRAVANDSMLDALRYAIKVELDHFAKLDIARDMGVDPRVWHVHSWHRVRGTNQSICTTCGAVADFVLADMSPAGTGVAGDAAAPLPDPGTAESLAPGVQR